MNSSKFFLSTLIAAAAMTSTGYAAELSYTNLFEQGGWLTGSLRNRAPFIVADGTASLSGSNWGQSYANYAVSHEMVKAGVLSFSVKMDVKNTNLSSLLYIETTENSFLIGKDYGENTISYGKGAKHDAPTYAFDTDLDGTGDVKVTDQTRLSTAVVSTTSPVTLSGIISWNGDSYSMEVSNGTDTATWDLGVTSFELTKVGLYGDGANVASNVVFSNFELSTSRRVFTWVGDESGAGAWNDNTAWKEGEKASPFLEGGDVVFSTAGASVTIGESERVIAGDVTVSADTTIVSDGVLSTESISVAEGATLSLSGTVALEEAIANSGTVVLDKDIVFDLDGLEATDGIYTIMNDPTGAIQGTLSYKNFSKGNHRSVFNVFGGLCSYQLGAVYSDMVWAGGETGTWNESDANWTRATEGSGSKIAFANGDSVTFSTANATVTIEKGIVVEPAAITVSAATELKIEEGATLSGGHLLVAGGSLSLVGSGNMTLSGDGTLDLTNGGSVIIGESQTGPTVSVKRIRVHNENTSTTETLTINSGTVTVTSEDSAASTSSGVLLGHWPSGTGKLVLNGGTVNAEKAFTVVSWNSDGALEINGGVYNTRGIALSASGDNRNKAATLSLVGGRLNVGTGGITFKSGGDAKTFNFYGGTLGTLTSDNWTSTQAITLSGTSATIDTAVYSVETQAVTATAGSITLSGVISGEGAALTKTGVGTLTLGGANTYSGGTTISGGTVIAQGESALGTGAVNITAGKLSLGGAAAAKVTNTVTMSSGTTIEIAGSNKVTLGAVNSEDSQTGTLKLNTTEKIDLDLDGALYLSNVTIGDKSSNINIDFGESGSITVENELNFGNAASPTTEGSFKYTFTIALSEKELSLLKNGEEVRRTLLASTSESANAGGIWNLGKNDGNTMFHTLQLILDNVNLESESEYQNLGIINANSMYELEGQNWYGLVFHENGGSDYVELFINSAPIPEPSAFGLLAGVGALALVAARRRRRK